MLFRNLDFGYIGTPKLSNGTQLWVKRPLLHEPIRGSYIDWLWKGETICVIGIPLIPTDLPFNCKSLQFPPTGFVYSITINKS